MPTFAENVQYGLTKLPTFASTSENYGAKALSEISYFDSKGATDAAHLLLKSLLDIPRVQDLYAHFESLLERNILSPLLRVAMSPTLVLGENGTGTGPIDIAEDSLMEPFDEWDEAPVETIKPKSTSLQVAFSYLELQCLFALYFGNMEPFKKSSKIVNFESYNVTHGTFKEFANRCKEHMVAPLTDEIIALTELNMADLKDILYQLENMPLGEYAYDIPVLGKNLDSYVRAQHRGVLADHDGLCVEVVSIRNSESVCARPTSFISFLERAVSRSEQYRTGLYYQNQESQFSDALLTQRAIQMLGCWEYSLTTQNCVTLSRWICDNQFLCNFSSARNPIGQLELRDAKFIGGRKRSKNHPKF